MSARATFWIFNLCLLPFYPLLAAYTLWRRFGQKKSAASFRGQWGSVPREVVERLWPSPPARRPVGTRPRSGRGEAYLKPHRQSLDDTVTVTAPLSQFLGEGSGVRATVIWIHAVSVGEQMAARPIARALKTQIPACKIALSATTDTGFALAQNAVASGEADAAFYFPLDLPPTVWRALNAIRPAVFCAVETELWPNFLHLARARGVLCFLANGRVSDNLFERAAQKSLTRWLWRWMISNLDALLMRADFDADRMRQIADAVGAQDAAAKVLVTGDAKLDGLEELENRAALRDKWRTELSVGANDLLLIFGSTHSGEEAIALGSWQSLRAQFPGLRLLLAPRHIERVNEVLALCEAMSTPAMRRSEIKPENQQSENVIILDTVGELAEIYAAGDVAFVGGSLVPRGGHNVLEPVLRGVPAVFGPHMANFRSHAELIQESRLGDGVQDETELVEKCAFWLQSESARRELPARAASTLAPHRGACERLAHIIAAKIQEQIKSKSYSG